MRCRSTIECCSAVRRNEIRPCAATWMGLEAITPRKSEKDKYHGITYMWNGKYSTNETKSDSQTQTTDLWWPGGCRGRELGAWVSRRRLLHAEWIKTRSSQVAQR